MVPRPIRAAPAQGYGKPRSYNRSCDSRACRILSWRSCCPTCLLELSPVVNALSGELAIAVCGSFSACDEPHPFTTDWKSVVRGVERGAYDGLLVRRCHTRSLPASSTDWKSVVRAGETATYDGLLVRRCHARSLPASSTDWKLRHAALGQARKKFTCICHSTSVARCTSSATFEADNLSWKESVPRRRFQLPSGQSPGSKFFWVHDKAGGQGT